MTKKKSSRAQRAGTGHQAPEPTPLTLWTVGHSTHPIDTFLEILQSAEIELLADVRRFPGSRRHPQFNQDAFAALLAATGIAYQHFVDLGGRRSERLTDSPNTAWRVEQFNAYADHMQSGEFLAALNELMTAARGSHTAIMCSEALPQSCHRRLIADALVARGWRVRHLLSSKRIEDHQLTPFAHIEGTVVTYPSAQLF